MDQLMELSTSHLDTNSHHRLDPKFRCHYLKIRARRSQWIWVIILSIVKRYSDRQSKVIMRLANPSPLQTHLVPQNRPQLMSSGATNFLGIKLSGLLHPLPSTTPVRSPKPSSKALSDCRIGLLVAEGGGVLEPRLFKWCLGLKLTLRWILRLWAVRTEVELARLDLDMGLRREV